MDSICPLMMTPKWHKVRMLCTINMYANASKFSECRAIVIANGILKKSAKCKQNHKTKLDVCSSNPYESNDSIPRRASVIFIRGKIGHAVRRACRHFVFIDCIFDHVLLQLLNVWQTQTLILTHTCRHVNRLTRVQTTLDTGKWAGYTKRFYYTHIICYCQISRNANMKFTKHEKENRISPK